MWVGCSGHGAYGVDVGSGCRNLANDPLEGGGAWGVCLLVFPQDVLYLIGGLRKSVNKRLPNQIGWGTIWLPIFLESCPNIVCIWRDCFGKQASVAKQCPTCAANRYEIRRGHISEYVSLRHSLFPASVVCLDMFEEMLRHQGLTPEGFQARVSTHVAGMCCPLPWG